jgi:hypothetical protein
VRKIAVIVSATPVTSLSAAPKDLLRELSGRGAGLGHEVVALVEVVQGGVLLELVDVPRCGLLEVVGLVDDGHGQRHHEQADQH